jgi:hypothetical protein
MSKLIDLLDQLKHRRTFGFLDDFDWYISPHRWTSVLSHAGSVAVGDNPAGILTILPSGGSVAANDESYARTTNALFQFAANKPILFEAAVQFTEANTNKANILVGVMDAVAAGAIADSNAGLKASYSGMAFFKQGNSNVWSCQTSVGAVQATTVTSKTAGGAHYQTLTGQWQPINSTQAEAAFFIDGLLVARQLFTFTGGVPMQLVAGMKNGSATLETLNVDYLAGYQLR